MKELLYAILKACGVLFALFVITLFIVGLTGQPLGLIPFGLGLVYYAARLYIFAARSVMGAARRSAERHKETAERPDRLSDVLSRDHRRIMDEAL